MAESFTDGGVRFDTEVGTPMDERSAVVVDTRIRDVGESAASAAVAAAESRIRDLAAEGREALALVRSMMAEGGVDAESPVDWQTAALIEQMDTLTRQALIREVARMASTTARPSAAWGAPRVVREVELFHDEPKTRTGDGAKFFTPLHVGAVGFPDEWIGYVSGHNSGAIWLVSAPSILGPWSWVEPVVGVPGSAARMVEPLLVNHAASPSAVMRGGRVWLYFHGPLDSDPLAQPTLVATSTDGRRFVSRGIVIPTERDNDASPYSTSTSYASVVEADGRLHALWQGTTGKDASTAVGRYQPLPTGYGTSMDGASWVKRDPVVYSASGDQGLLAPGAVRLTDGWMVCGSRRSSDGGKTGGQVQSVGCYMGPSLDRLHWVGDIVLPGARTQYINSPVFAFHEGSMWMIGGVLRAGAGVPVISAFELDWSGA